MPLDFMCHLRLVPSAGSERAVVGDTGSGALDDRNEIVEICSTLYEVDLRGVDHQERAIPVVKEEFRVRLRHLFDVVLRRQTCIACAPLESRNQYLGSRL